MWYGGAEMSNFLDIILTVLISAAVVAALWLIYGRLVTPVSAGKGERLFAAIYARGATPQLEKTVNGLLWLISTGKAHMELLIIDGGMDAESRKIAELLAQDHGEIRLCAPEDLPKLFRERTEEDYWREEVSD